MNPALDVLRTGVDSYAAYLQPSGELFDPVFGEPTQYGTAYHALGNAVLATHGPAERRTEYADRARRGLLAALAHTADPSTPPVASGFDEGTGDSSAVNHRDFTWPPILKAYRLLRSLDVVSVEEVGARIAAVDILASFRSRPPSNWSSVWLSGEWIRIQEGLSPFTVADVDGWLEVFFEELIDIDLGFYAEPGLPNSYDLFTRYHLADLLAEGYAGRWRGELARLLDTGLGRSLAVQLSDGSLASAHRSTGQTWTLGAQVAYFTHAGPRAGAATAATRAFAAMRRWQRAGGPFAPVENVLPPSFRVGYERYTADAHYGNLALGFLAVAVLHGFTGADIDALPADRALSVRVEQAPTYRAVLHAGPYSAAVNAAPAPAYDAFGLTDLTFGPGRVLQFASSVRHARSGRLLNLGSDRAPAGGTDASLTGTIQAEGESGVRVRLENDDIGWYEQLVSVDGGDGVTVTERVPDGPNPCTALLVPYLLDPGTGVRTRVREIENGVLLEYGDERVTVRLDVPIAARVVLEHGFENRRGLCGLVRLRLAEPTTDLTYRIARQT